MHKRQTTFENIFGKGEIARNERFLLFPQCFLLNQIIISPFVHIFDIISLFAAEFEVPKISISSKGLSKSSGQDKNSFQSHYHKSMFYCHYFMGTQIKPLYTECYLGPFVNSIDLDLTAMNMQSDLRSTV